MEGKKKAVPEIRFKGFEEVWKSFVLKDIATFSKGRGYSKNDLKPSGTPIILYGRLYTNYETVICDVDTFVTQNPNSVVSKGGEVIIPASGEDAKDISRASVVMQKGVILGGDLNIISTISEEYNPVFVAQSFLTHNVQSKISNCAQGKSIVHLHNSDLEDVKLILPSGAEQKNISNYLSELDALIKLLNTKYESLQHLKETMLEKMFPKDGADVPEIRFKGFSGAWKTGKLSELATTKARIGWQGLTKSEFLEDGDYYLITGTDFNNGRINFETCHYIDETRYLQDSNIQLRENDILVTKDGTLGKVAYVTNLNKPATLNTGVFVVRCFNKMITSEYLFHYLMTPNLLRYANDQATGGTIKHLNQNILVNFPVRYPEDKKEQELICIYINALESSMADIQNKLDKLNTLKKALLEKMFV